MSLSNAAESNLLKLIFNNTTWALVGNATGIVGSGAAGSLYVALHTADPGEAGSQNSFEATYGSYARVAIARTTGAFTVTGTNPCQVANVAIVNFPSCTSGTNTLTHFSIGLSSSGAGQILVFGALSIQLNVSTGITPSFPIAALVTTVE